MAEPRKQIVDHLAALMGWTTAGPFTASVNGVEIIGEITDGAVVVQEVNLSANALEKIVHEKLREIGVPVPLNSVFEFTLKSSDYGENTWGDGVSIKAKKE